MRTCLLAVGDFAQLRGVDPTNAKDSPLWSQFRIIHLREMRRCKCPKLKWALELLRNHTPSGKQLKKILKTHRAPTTQHPDSDPNLQPQLQDIRQVLSRDARHAVRHLHQGRHPPSQHLGRGSHLRGGRALGCFGLRARKQSRQLLARGADCCGALPDAPLRGHEGDHHQKRRQGAFLRERHGRCRPGAPPFRRSDTDKHEGEAPDPSCDNAVRFARRAGQGDLFPTSPRIQYHFAQDPRGNRPASDSVAGQGDGGCSLRCAIPRAKGRRLALPGLHSARPLSPVSQRVAEPRFFAPACPTVAGPAILYIHHIE